VDECWQGKERRRRKGAWERREVWE